MIAHQVLLKQCVRCRSGTVGVQLNNFIGSQILYEPCKTEQVRFLFLGNVRARLSQFCVPTSDWCVIPTSIMHVSFAFVEELVYVNVIKRQMLLSFQYEVAAHHVCAFCNQLDRTIPAALLLSYIHRKVNLIFSSSASYQETSCTMGKLTAFKYQLE